MRETDKRLGEEFARGGGRKGRDGKGRATDRQSPRTSDPSSSHFRLWNCQGEVGSRVEAVCMRGGLIIFLF